MIAGEARAQLETLEDTIAAARARATQLSGFALYAAASEAMYFTACGDGSSRSFDQVRTTEAARAVGAVLSNLKNPISNDRLPLGDTLEEVLERRETIRAFLLDVLPSLNEKLELGITFEKGAVDG